MNCPFCAEEIHDEAKKCKHCGEFLVDGTQPGKGSSAKTIVIIAVVCAVGCLCVPGLLASLLMPALMKAKQKANRAKCSNDLRMLGLAASQYGADKRLFPHVTKTQELDGGVESNHTPKVIRTLIYAGYHDSPEALVCPSSDDMSFGAIAPRGKQWFWEGGTNPTDGSQSPLYDGAPDPALKDTSELSYGWTRRGLGPNAPSTTRLAADRAVREKVGVANPPDALVGNHPDGWNVLRLDATVQWHSTQASPFPGATLTGTSDPKRDAYLGIKVQTDPTRLR